MLRVLMVLEDYGELMFLQTVLKKVGFDVDAIQNPRGFSDSLLRMNPDILVMTANGKKVKGEELAESVRRTRGIPRIILLSAPGTAVNKSIAVDGWLESPVPALHLIEMIADISSLNKKVLTDKFNKLRLQEIAEQTGRTLKADESDQDMMDASRVVSGNFTTPTSTSLSEAERQERYKKFLKEEPPPQHLFAVKQVAEQVRSLRKNESKEDLADLERERRAFVEQLFKKKA